MKELDVKNLDKNVFSLIGDQWMLVTAGNKEKCNTMTASWGGLGVLWGWPAATIYIRPQRFTFPFLEREDYFTLSFLPEEYRKALAYCGAHSGREGDKIALCGLHTDYAACGAPYIRESELVLVCRKAYWQDIDPAHFLTGDIDEKWYPEKDYHRMYIGRIAEAYRN